MFGIVYTNGSYTRPTESLIHHLLCLSRSSHGIFFLLDIWTVLFAKAESQASSLETKISSDIYL